MLVGDGSDANFVGSILGRSGRSEGGFELEGLADGVGLPFP